MAIFNYTNYKSITHNYEIGIAIKKLRPSGKLTLGNWTLPINSLMYPSKMWCYVIVHQRVTATVRMIIIELMGYTDFGWKNGLELLVLWFSSSFSMGEVGWGKSAGRLWQVSDGIWVVSRGQMLRTPTAAAAEAQAAALEGKKGCHAAIFLPADSWIFWYGGFLKWGHPKTDGFL